MLFFFARLNNIHCVAESKEHRKIAKFYKIGNTVKKKIKIIFVKFDMVHNMCRCTTHHTAFRMLFFSFIFLCKSIKIMSLPIFIFSALYFICNFFDTFLFTPFCFSLLIFFFFCWSIPVLCRLTSSYKKKEP